MMLNRRGFLAGLLATPAVVAASSLMPVRGIIMPVRPHKVIIPDFGAGEWTIDRIDGALAWYKHAGFDGYAKVWYDQHASDLWLAAQKVKSYAE